MKLVCQVAIATLWVIGFFRELFYADFWKGAA